MRKITTLALSAALATTLATGLTHAAEGIEFSGNITTAFGWQHDDGSALDRGSCKNGIGGLGCNAADLRGSGRGILGDFRGLATPNRDTFNFYVDEVELDFQKSFGENIRLRADVDFGRLLSGTTKNGGANDVIEQGYVSFNLPMGQGAEVSIGRFNAPMGYESVDRVDNVAVSYTNIFRYARPHNLTGAKLYYAFNDSFDWNLYVVNNLADSFSNAAGTDSAIPSFGTRFGFTWGEKGRENTVGLSYAGGPELGGSNTYSTHIADLDFTFHFGESLMLAGEGIYRQDSTSHLGNLPTSKIFGGNLLLNYQPSEIWNAYFRYGYIHDVNPTAAYTGTDQQIHDFTLGAGYQITDDAKLKLEYRLDLAQYSQAEAAGDRSSISQGVAMEFGYRF